MKETIETLYDRYIKLRGTNLYDSSNTNYTNLKKDLILAIYNKVASIAAFKAYKKLHINYSIEDLKCFTFEGIERGIDSYDPNKSNMFSFFLLTAYRSIVVNIIEDQKQTLYYWQINKERDKVIDELNTVEGTKRRSEDDINTIVKQRKKYKYIAQLKGKLPRRLYFNSLSTLEQGTTNDVFKGSQQYDIEDKNAQISDYDEKTEYLRYLIYNLKEVRNPYYDYYNGKKPLRLGNTEKNKKKWFKIMKLHYIDGLNFKEVAELLNGSEDMITNKAAWIRSAMREQYSKDELLLLIQNK